MQRETQAQRDFLEQRERLDLQGQQALKDYQGLLAWSVQLARRVCKDLLGLQEPSESSEDREPLGPKGQRG